MKSSGVAAPSTTRPWNSASPLWQRRRVSISRYEQEAELKDIRAEFPEYAAIHSHVLQDVLARLDKTYQAFFRRVQRGEKAGLSALQGPRPLSTPLPTRSMATAHAGQRLSGPLQDWPYRASTGPVRSRAHPRRSRISERPTAGMSASPARTCRCPLAATGQETGIDLGLESFATLADGTIIHTPGCYRKAERISQLPAAGRPTQEREQPQRKKAVALLAKAHQKVRRQRQDFHHKTALRLVRPTM